MSLEGVIWSFEGEKWQNIPFLGRTRNSVLVPKRGISVPIGQRQSGTGTKSWWYRYPFTSKGLVPVPIKVEPVPMLPAALIFVPLHC